MKEVEERHCPNSYGYNTTYVNETLDWTIPSLCMIGHFTRLQKIGQPIQKMRVLDHTTKVVLHPASLVYHLKIKNLHLGSMSFLNYN